MAADDRSGPASRLTPTTGTDGLAAGATQTAAFRIGALRVELSADPGAARLVVASETERDVYVVEPAALAAWATATRRLLTLAPADSADAAVEYRAPFLIDREGRASIAFEGHVSGHGVTFRMLVTGESARIAGIMSGADLIRDLTDAAAGAVVVARTPSS